MKKIKDNLYLKNGPFIRFSQKICSMRYEVYYHPAFYKLLEKNIKGIWKKMRESNTINIEPNLFIEKDRLYDKFIKKHRYKPIINGLNIGIINKTGQRIVLPSLGKTYFDNSINHIQYVPKDWIIVDETEKNINIPLYPNDSLFNNCALPSQKIINLEKKGLIFNNWEKKNKNHWLQIKDITKLKPGEQIELVSLDRNLLDNGMKNVKYNKIYKPKYCFKYNLVIYTHEKDLQGTLFHSYQQKEINNKKKTKKGGSYLIEPYEFDINYKEDEWAPLFKGYLQEKSLDIKKKKWDTFSKDTYIGRRGPMIPWNKLDKLESIYWLNLEE